MTDHDKAILKIARLGKDLIQEGTDKEDEGLLRIGLALNCFVATAANDDLAEFINHTMEFVFNKAMQDRNTPDFIRGITRKARAINYLQNDGALN
jgi:hypothetical protein